VWLSGISPNEFHFNHFCIRRIVMGVRSTTPPSVTPERTAPGGAPIIGGEEDRGEGPGPDIMDADTLNGDAVVNSDEEDLGKIEAIMLDVRAGRIAYAVLSFGGFLGMGSKLFALPWSALTLDARNKRFILNIPKEHLKQAPGFDKDDWPRMADSNWATDLHAYYNVRPYWEEDLEPIRDPRRSNPNVY